MANFHAFRVICGRAARDFIPPLSCTIEENQGAAICRTPAGLVRAEAARFLRLRYRNCDFEWSCHSLNQCIIFHGTLQSDLDVRSFNFFPFYYRSLAYLCTRESFNTSALSAHEREVNLGRRYIPFILVTYVFIDIEEDRLVLYKQPCHVKSNRT